MSAGWFYRREGWFEDSNEGPFSDGQLLQLCFDGKLTPSTFVTHPTKTKGQWVRLERFPTATKRITEGENHRKREQAVRDEHIRQKRADEKQLREEQRRAAIKMAAEQRSNSPIARFLTDGQNEATIARIYDHVQQILTSQEVIEYMAVQAKPVAIAPDCIVATNRRFIIFRQGILGQTDFSDYLWRDLFDARIQEGMIFATLRFRATNGHMLRIDYLPKSQARKVYRVAQEREEAAHEERRQRAMEETRAGAGNIVVNAAIAPVPATSQGNNTSNSDDAVQKLKKLKCMLDEGLISEEEYNLTKSRILESM